MIRYLIKNNLKLMLRNKWVLAVMILGPILVIATLSSAFKELMKSYEGMREFKAGYRVEEGSGMEFLVAPVKEFGKESGITFLEYPDGEPKEIMEHNELAGFVEFGKERYIIYESDDYVMEGIALEYFLDRVMEEGKKQILHEMMPNNEKEEVKLPVFKLEYMPAVDSKDYYGIIEIVYFLWIGLICGANVLISEQRNKINRKFMVAPISALKLYLAKWIPIVLTTTVGIAIATLATILLFDIHWGNFLMSTMILLLAIMASSAMGLLFYTVCRNLAMTVVALFTSVWFMGLFGGSFETYMFSSWISDEIKNASPIYHINRTLVEYSCMGKSSYTGSCIAYMLGLIMICSILAIAIDCITKRGRA